MATFQPPTKPPITVTPVPLPKQPTASIEARDPRERKRGRITIPLPSKPRDYVPGSGPPLQRVSLLPPRDSTAYIIERILLPSPGPAPNGKPLPRRMTYIVGWRDLAAARMLVPAMSVLDYVSPQALEEWEWELEMQLDEDRAVMEENKRLNKPANGKKKRGRPPVHSQIEAAAVAAEPETEDQIKERLARGGMSLSTPQKTRLLDFEGLSDEEESPSRQLERETLEMPGRHIRDSDSAEDGRLGAASTGGISRPPFPKLSSSGWNSSMETSEEPVVFPEASFREKFPAPVSGRPVPIPAKKSGSKNASILSFFPSAGSGDLNSASGFQNEFAQQTVTHPSVKSPKRTPIPKPKATKKKADKQRHPVSEPPLESGEPSWEVKHLEGVELFEVEGRGFVRYFRVRWEGDWPPEQNPSWEPEENLPPTLVRNYLKTSKKRRKTSHGRLPDMEKQASGGTNRRANDSKQAGMARNEVKKYKTVSDAFAGDSDDMVLIEDVPDDRGYASSHAGEDDDELFLVEETQNASAKTGWKANKMAFPPAFRHL